MKKILFTRFQKNLMDYGYYISSCRIPQTLDNFIRDDGDSGRLPWHVLFSDQHRTVIGLKYRLPLHVKDNAGRPTTAFAGYELERGEPLPYFNAVHSKLGVIEQEFLDARARIENGEKGSALRGSTTRFERGTHTGTAWDKAIDAFERDRQTTRMFISDARGQGKEVDLIKKAGEIAAMKDKLLRRPAVNPDTGNLADTAAHSAKVSRAETGFAYRNSLTQKKTVEPVLGFGESSKAFGSILVLVSSAFAVALLGCWWMHRRPAPEQYSNSVDANRSRVELSLQEHTRAPTPLTLER